MEKLVNEPISKSRILVAQNYEDLCQELVREILALSEKFIASCDRFTFALSGGSTPKGVYALMGGPEYRDKFQWHRIHFFWSDERWVLPEDAKSNYRMAVDALLAKVDIPPENIHPIQTSTGSVGSAPSLAGGTPESSAALYEKQLGSFFGLKNGGIPRFDLMLLGLGPDGHTASLFPGDRANFETNRLVAPVSQKEMDPSERITFTLPVLNHAAVIFFLASGQEKSQILQTVLEGNGGELPAQKVNPGEGEVWWFVDKPAASALKREREDRS